MRNTYAHHEPLSTVIRVVREPSSDLGDRHRRDIVAVSPHAERFQLHRRCTSAPRHTAHTTACAYSRLCVRGASKESGPESDECNERSPRSRQRGRSPELFSPFLPPSLFNSAVVLGRQRGVPSRTCTACFRLNKIYSLRLSGKPRRRAIYTAATAVPRWRGDLYRNSFKEIKRSSSFGELDFSHRVPSSLVEFIFSQQRRIVSVLILLRFLKSDALPDLNRNASRGTCRYLTVVLLFFHIFSRVSFGTVLFCTRIALECAC